ncbi:diguanylate cyclase (GGDEF) domain-containing protein [Amphibacillus marinus]|uniref:Diguanylate cyclase (GGDEF) domain-containing protein n=1 Tax=Amphibacillus marinus TaxID=872970 RepID=A0A1H8T1F6_9BACI|nr:sensor domain-containing diguanylate cyclase [Amphibacillus marinus]SEO84655.1 diguanylate cyclase (GGDEF) domain-containing protein [Amphibacillus marinus]
MKPYIFNHNRHSFVHDQSGYYHKSESLDIILNQLKLLCKVEAVALFLYDSWTDRYKLTKIVCETSILPVQSLDQQIVNRLNQYQGIITEPASSIVKGRTSSVHCVGLFNQGFMHGVLVFFQPTNYQPSDKQKQLLLKQADNLNQILIELSNTYHAIEQANKYEFIYNVTQEFHSSMNPKDVLSEIINTIASIYPKFKCYLFLSKDFQGDQDLPVRELIYNEQYADKASVQAFLTGEVKVVVKSRESKITLYAPLNGKQGIYGVLQLTAYDVEQIPNEDIEFIQILANTGGNALENAQLYQQSNQFIQDLQLINSFVHELNKLKRLSDVASFMKNQFIQSFSADELGFLQFNSIGNFEVNTESTRFFLEQGIPCELTEPLHEVSKTTEPIFIGDVGQTADFSFRSVVLLPMVQSNQIIGLVILLHKNPYYFSFDQFKLMKSLIQHATLAFSNIILKEQLEKAVITDYLTKLFSRKYLDEKCSEHLRRDHEGVFILIDLDDFKKVNDSYGHDVGDTILIQVSNVIRREIDGKGFAARWGGEELAIYLPTATYEQGEHFAERLRHLIEHTTEPSVTASIGVTHWKESMDISLIKLFDKTDQALYQAKRAGKNQLQYSILS